MAHLLALNVYSGLPRSGKKSGKRNFFQVREKSGNLGLHQGNFCKKAESRGKVRAFQNFLKSDVLWQCINVLKELEKSELFFPKVIWPSVFQNFLII